MGVIGCGWITEYLKQIVQNVNSIEIVAAVDPIIEKAVKLAGQDHSYQNAEDMYRNEDFDVVYIATPHHLHKPMIKQAFEEEKHVFCEKPVTTSVKDARDILNLDKKYSSLKLGFNYQYRYDYNCYNLVNAVQEGYLGEIYYATCNVYFSRSSDYFNEGSWRTKKETAGGGTLLIQGSHIIDIMIWALGEPLNVIGKIDNLKFKTIDVEDIGFGIIEFENGSYGQVSSSMILKSRKRRNVDRVELNIFGENGSCYYQGPWPLSSIKWEGIKEYKIKEYNQGVSHFVECLKAYSDWILYDEPFLNTAEESSKVLRLLKALYKSSESGKKENIENL